VAGRGPDVHFDLLQIAFWGIYLLFLSRFERTIKATAAVATFWPT